MTGYTPLFSKIVDSSLWLEADFVVKIFLTMLAKKDADNVVRGSAFNISQWAKKTEAEVLEALKILTSPDTRRLEPQPFDGRRIQKVEDGWLLLNGAIHQQMMVKINRRAYKAAHEAMRRERGREIPFKLAGHTDQQAIPPAKHGSVPTPGIAEEIYNAYPRKVGRPVALRAITKALTKVLPDVLLNKTKEYATARIGEPEQFTPHPATWYNGERYNDAPTTWKSNSNGTPPKPNPRNFGVCVGPTVYGSHIKPRLQREREEKARLAQQVAAAGSNPPPA